MRTIEDVRNEVISTLSDFDHDYNIEAILDELKGMLAFDQRNGYASIDSLGSAEYTELLERNELLYAVYVYNKYASQVGNRYEWDRCDECEAEYVTEHADWETTKKLFDETVESWDDSECYNIVKVRNGLDTIEYKEAELRCFSKGYDDSTKDYDDVEFESVVCSEWSLPEAVEKQAKLAELDYWRFLDYKAEGYTHLSDRMEEIRSKKEQEN